MTATQHDNFTALAELAPTGKLRAGVAVGPAGSAVWATRDPLSGRPRGVTIDLATALGEQLGVPVELVEYKSTGEIIAAADQNAWDVAFTPVDDERRTRVSFGPNYFVGESTYAVLGASAIASIEDVDAKGVRVVGVANTATIRSAKRALKTAELIETTALDAAVEMLKTGEADALALGRESLRSLLPQLPGARILDGAFHAAGTAIAVPLNKPAALDYVTKFIEKAKTNGTARRAFDRNSMQECDVAPPGSRS